MKTASSSRFLKCPEPAILWFWNFFLKTITGGSFMLLKQPELEDLWCWFWKF
jgi:hypothetical protein